MVYLRVVCEKCIQRSIVRAAQCQIVNAAPVSGVLYDLERCAGHRINVCFVHFHSSCLGGSLDVEWIDFFTAGDIAPELHL